MRYEKVREMNIEYGPSTVAREGRTNTFLRLHMRNRLYARGLDTTFEAALNVASKRQGHD